MISLTHDGRDYVDWDEVSLTDAGIPQSVIDAAKSAQLLSDIYGRRKVAYVSESDPLYMEWQFDQTPESEQAWREKVAEIKTRYPLPSES